MVLVVQRDLGAQLSGGLVDFEQVRRRNAIGEPVMVFVGGTDGSAQVAPRRQVLGDASRVVAVRVKHGRTLSGFTVSVRLALTAAAVLPM